MNNWPVLQGYLFVKTLLTFNGIYGNIMTVILYKIIKYFFLTVKTVISLNGCNFCAARSNIC